MNAEALALGRMSRLHLALRHINRAIVHAVQRDELLREVCRAAVEDGGFVSATIGLADAARDELIPRAHWGGHAAFNTAMSLEAGAAPADCSAIVQAFRTGVHCICDDLCCAPAVGGWQQRMLSLGVASIGAFPLRCDGKVAGVLCVCCAERGFFGAAELEVLDEAAADVSFALTNFAREEDRARSDEIVNRFAAIIESTNDAVVSKTTDGIITSWNPAAEKMFGYTAEEILGHNILELIPPERAAEEPIILARIVRGERLVDVETVRIRKNGEHFPVSITISPLKSADGAVVGASKIVRDITERRQAAEALREANANLEVRVRERTTELAVAKERAESADRLKSAFLATMSHELRTPLNSIIGFTGLILQELAGPLNEEQARQLSMVQGSARHLLSLINDVLDISKIEAGQLEVHASQFELLPSLRRVMAAVEPMALQKNLKLTLEAPQDLGSMASDRRRVEQVLMNLINNAVKFTECGEVTLIVEALDIYVMPQSHRAQRCVRFRVRDTGIGIRPEDVATLFRPFRQIDSGLTRLHEGTGLGLAICRRLAELLNGTITVRSELGAGAEFLFTLPRNHTEIA